MEKETIPSENIAFAVLNNGQIVNNLTDKEAQPKVELFVNLFKGLEDVVNGSNKEVFSAFCLSWIIFNNIIEKVMIVRLESEKNKNKDQ